MIWTGLFGGDEPVCRDCRLRENNLRAQNWNGPRSGTPPQVTGSLILLAVALSLAYWTKSRVAPWLVADRWAVWDGQVWRLFLSIFPHADILHLAFNLYWTWQFGRIVEPWTGSLRFAGFVVLTAVGSSAAQFLSESPGIGLSGVGYALFGLLYALRRDRDFAAEEMTPQIIKLFVGWFFLCIVLTYAKIYPVANVAHGVGALLGWLVGRAVLAKRPTWLLAGLTAAVLALAGACLYMPWNADYAIRRAIKALESGDSEAAMYWIGKANGASPEGFPRLGDLSRPPAEPDQ